MVKYELIVKTTVTTKERIAKKEVRLREAFRKFCAGEANKLTNAENPELFAQRVLDYQRLSNIDDVKVAFASLVEADIKTEELELRAQFMPLRMSEVGKKEFEQAIVERAKWLKEFKLPTYKAIASLCERVATSKADKAQKAA